MSVSHLNIGYPGQQSASFVQFYQLLNLIQSTTATIPYSRFAFGRKDFRYLLFHIHGKYRPRSYMSLHVLRPQYKASLRYHLSPPEISKMIDSGPDTHFTSQNIQCWALEQSIQHNFQHCYQFKAAAKSLQSCPTLCDPIDSSPPASAVPGTLQARTLEWVAISFSNA